MWLNIMRTSVQNPSINYKQSLSYNRDSRYSKMYGQHYTDLLSTYTDYQWISFFTWSQVNLTDGLLIQFGDYRTLKQEQSRWWKASANILLPVAIEHCGFMVCTAESIWSAVRPCSTPICSQRRVRKHTVSDGSVWRFRSRLHTNFAYLWKGRDLSAIFNKSFIFAYPSGK